MRNKMIQYMKSKNWNADEKEISVVFSDWLEHKNKSIEEIVDKWLRAKDIKSSEYLKYVNNSWNFSIDYLNVLRLKLFGYNSTKKWLVENNEEDFTVYYDEAEYLF